MFSSNINIVGKLRLNDSKNPVELKVSIFTLYLFKKKQPACEKKKMPF